MGNDNVVGDKKANAELLNNHFVPIVDSAAQISEVGYGQD